MKIIVITTLLTLLFLPESVFSQSQNWWRVNGNSAGSNQFLGTTNNQSLNFRTNNLDRMQILPNGQFRLNSFALGNSGLLTFDATGLLTPLLFNGSGNMVLSNNGSFLPVSSFSNWTLDGNYLFTENTFVGIGTQTPSKTLTVEGDALITGTVTTSGLNVLHKIQADTIKGAIRVDVNGNLMLGEEDGYNGITSRQEELRINSRPGYDHNVVINANTNGNLGIGVTNPQEKFDLFGNARLSGDVIFSSYADSANNEDRILFVDEDGRTTPKKLNDLALEMYLEPLACFQGYKPMWYNDEGKLYTGHLTGTGCETNVGIGTADPESKLHVIGLTRTSRLHVGHYNENNTALLSGYRIGSLNSSQSIVTFGRHLNSVDFNYFDLRMDGTLRLRNQTRDVFLVNVQEETVYARKIVVDEEVWPDYVFDEKYELMSLEEVKAYIKEHGHLPNVPSATNVEENGVNLGEMAKITLEKVEELTLYILQQQELLEKQQGLLEKQQEEIERLKAEVKN